MSPTKKDPNSKFRPSKLMFKTNESSASINNTITSPKGTDMNPPLSSKLSFLITTNK